MKLKLENDIHATVEIDGNKFIDLDDSVVYQEITSDSVSLYIKSKEDKKEIKIRLLKAKVSET